MQLGAMLRKEIQILFSNRLLIFANILIPILVICVNLAYTKSAVINILIGYYGEPQIDSQIGKKMNQYTDDVSVQFVAYEDEESVRDAYENEEICAYISFIDASHLEIYWDNENQKSSLAYQYLIKSLQEINSSNYTDDLLNEIIAAQTFMITQTVMLTKETTETINPYIWTGFIWIFVYSNLSLAITQMQQERNTRTILYLCKAGTSNFYLFLSKAIVAIIQFLLIITAFIIVVTKLNLFTCRFWMPQILFYLLVCICIVSLGHLLGTLIKNSSILVIIQMMIVLPLMLVNALQTSVYDIFLINNPIYCSLTIAKNASMGKMSSMIDICICLCTSIVCYTIAGIYLKKREPIKLCKLQ